MNRSQLIERKHQIIAEIRQTRRELAAAHQRDDHRNAGRARYLEGRLERLMAEEYRLRLAIDRSR
ncbi:MAG: hypothetical protein U9R25_02265 [Chloroflexota bacterium]|nr:hypothetical protein [Chloroflexota bacterium]